MITLNNPKLVKLLEDKEILVKAGRKVSSEIETIEFKINRYVEKEKAITAKVECKELVEKGTIINKQIDKLIAEIEVIAKEINTEKLSKIPKDVEVAHKDLMKQKEEKERERNKIALKVQKIKDKVVPIIKKEVKPLLKEYEDIETAKVEKGQVVIETFNHLEQFKTSFKNKK